jgi:hypothetical protein
LAKLTRRRNKDSSQKQFISNTPPAAVEPHKACLEYRETLRHCIFFLFLFLTLPIYKIVKQQYFWAWYMGLADAPQELHTAKLDGMARRHLGQHG